MEDKIVVIMGVITLAAIGYLIYLVYSKQQLVNASSGSGQASSPTPSMSSYPSTTPTYSPPIVTVPPVPPITPYPSSTPTPSQPFVVNTYTVSDSNVLIPLLSETFVITVKPLSNQVSLMAWFNIENDILQHGDSLILNSNPITITQETPIIYSDVLKSQNIPYEGYPYLVIAVAGSAEIKASFFV